MYYIEFVLLLTSLICFNVYDWLCGCDRDQEQLYIALVCVSMSLSMIVSWFMFVLNIHSFIHFTFHVSCTGMNTTDLETVTMVKKVQQ